MTTVHEALPDAGILHERLVVHAIVQQQKCTRLSTHRHDSALSLEHLFYRISLVVSVDEQVGNKLAIVVIAILRTGHDNTRWNVLFVIHNVSDERGLAGSTLSDEHTHLVVADDARVKLFQL